MTPLRDWREEALLHVQYTLSVGGVSSRVLPRLSRQQTNRAHESHHCEAHTIVRRTDKHHVRTYVNGFQAGLLRAVQVVLPVLPSDKYCSSPPFSDFSERRLLKLVPTCGSRKRRSHFATQVKTKTVSTIHQIYATRSSDPPKRKHQHMAEDATFPARDSNCSRNLHESSPSLMRILPPTSQTSFNLVNLRKLRFVNRRANNHN